MEIIFYSWILPILIGLVIFYFWKFKGQTIKDFVDEISYSDSIVPPYWLFITFPIVNILFIVAWCVLMIYKGIFFLYRKFPRPHINYERLKNILDNFLNLKIK